MNQPKQSCVNISINIMELIVFITHIWLYGRFYISEFTCFSFFSPDLCCDIWARFVHFLLQLYRLLRIGALLRMGWQFHCTHGCYFYCTIPRQFILHLHRYNILRSPRGTHSWVSRSKKCPLESGNIWSSQVLSNYIYYTIFQCGRVKKTYKKRLFVVSLFLFSF